MMDDGRRRGLGRGLSALLEEDAADFTTLNRARTTKDVPVELLRPSPFQPRRRFDDDEQENLVSSVRNRGILQPILVRWSAMEADAYEIIAGERRWRAAQSAELHTVPVLVRDLDDSQALEFVLIENIQRQDLTPLEEAEGYRRLIDEFGQTQEQLAEVVGKSRSHVTNLLRLLGLPEPVREMLQDSRLTAGHARALVTVADPFEVAEKVVAKGLNVRQTERLAQASGARRRAVLPVEKDADTKALERQLTQNLGLRVAVNHRGDRGGEVRITYRTLEQLDEICRRLGQDVRDVASTLA